MEWVMATMVCATTLHRVKIQNRIVREPPPVMARGTVSTTWLGPLAAMTTNVAAVHVPTVSAATQPVMVSARSVRPDTVKPFPPVKIHRTSAKAPQHATVGLVPAMAQHRAIAATKTTSARTHCIAALTAFAATRPATASVDVVMLPGMSAHA